MGEYEPNDSRNVTGAGNKAGQNEGNPNTRQGGQHWQQSSHQTQPGALNDPAQNQQNPISQSSQQGHGQDGGMRSQQQQFQQGGGQMGGGQSANSGAGQMGGGSGYQGTAAGGQNESMRQDTSGQSRFAEQIREHMEVIGADGVHVGTVDHVDGDRIKLTKKDSGAGFEGGRHEGHHHYLSLGLVAEIEGNTVRLSANGDVAYGMEEEEGGEAS